MSYSHSLILLPCPRWGTPELLHPAHPQPKPPDSCNERVCHRKGSSVQSAVVPPHSAAGGQAGCCCHPPCTAPGAPGAPNHKTGPNISSTQSKEGNSRVRPDTSRSMAAWDRGAHLTPQTSLPAGTRCSTMLCAYARCYWPGPSRHKALPPGAQPGSGLRTLQQEQPAAPAPHRTALLGSPQHHPTRAWGCCTGTHMYTAHKICPNIPKLDVSRAPLPTPLVQLCVAVTQLTADTWAKHGAGSSTVTRGIPTSAVCQRKLPAKVQANAYEVQKALRCPLSSSTDCWGKMQAVTSAPLFVQPL